MEKYTKHGRRAGRKVGGNVGKLGKAEEAEKGFTIMESSLEEIMSIEKENLDCSGVIMKHSTPKAKRRLVFKDVANTCPVSSWSQTKTKFGTVNISPSGKF